MRKNRFFIAASESLENGEDNQLENNIASVKRKLIFSKK
ncbi:MAG: hypothetical protein S4CHLAM7_04160 [Chlamydiae bacterium]|nr:hypothetical protein [Chlamydiota bacterium]